MLTLDQEQLAYADLQLRRIKKARRNLDALLTPSEPPPAPSLSTLFGMTADDIAGWEADADALCGAIRRFNSGFPSTVDNSSSRPWLDGALGADHEPEQNGAHPQGRWDADEWIGLQANLAALIAEANAAHPSHTPLDHFTCHIPWNYLNKSRTVYADAAMELADSNGGLTIVTWDPYGGETAINQGSLENCYTIMDGKSYGGPWGIAEYGWGNADAAVRVPGLHSWNTSMVQNGARFGLYFNLLYQGTDFLLDEPAEIEAMAEYLPGV